MTLQTLEHTDVRGNKLHYLKITNSIGTEFMLNVGERTVKKINEMNAEETVTTTVPTVPTTTEKKK